MEKLLFINISTNIKNCYKVYLYSDAFALSICFFDSLKNNKTKQHFTPHEVNNSNNLSKVKYKKNMREREKSKNRHALC